MCQCTCLADALIMEAIEILKLTRDKARARDTLRQSMKRYNFVYWEELATVSKYKEQEMKYPYGKLHADSLGRTPKWLED